MITARAFAGKHYAVLGLARSGMATVESLLASGAQVTAWDRQQTPRAKLEGRCTLADPMEIDVDATGPRGRPFAVARGVTFSTGSADTIAAFLDERLAPGGYAYFLVASGQATLATVGDNSDRDLARFPGLLGSGRGIEVRFHGSSVGASSCGN